MIPLTRPDEPAILADNREKWLTKFLDKRSASPGERLPGSQYAHAKILHALEGMSFKKCFYCESKPEKRTVDHYVVVAERPDLAFVWANLYLSCQDCQSKRANKDMPTSECLDRAIRPCRLASISPSSASRSRQGPARSAGTRQSRSTDSTTTDWTPNGSSSSSCSMRRAAKFISR